MNQRPALSLPTGSSHGNSEVSDARLTSMSRFFSILIVAFVLATLPPHTVVESLAQDLTDSPQTRVVLTKLSAPIYPPAARAAHVTGDVDLMLAIRQDGSIESAVVVGGPPMLRPAALDSAQHTRFECHECSEKLNSYRLVYAFQIKGDCGCETPPKESNSNSGTRDQTYPRVTQVQNRVTVTAYITIICDPASLRKNRSMKCLYLWRCGL
jgi:hypothetical protein